MSKKKLPLAFGILIMNLLLMSSVIGNAIAAIAKSFPNEPISKVQMLSTVPQLGQVIATLGFSWLTYKISRKNIALLGILCVVVGGLIPLVYNSNLNIILLCMIILGLGTGTISNVGPVLLQEHFDGDERATAMGWSVGFNNIGMMLFTALGGFLGANNWRNMFWIYGIAIIVFAITFFLVPKDTVVKKETNSAGKTSYFATLKHVNGLAYLFILITFLTSICMMSFMANQSIVLAGKGMGTGYTSLVVTVGNIGGILTAMFMGKITKFTRSKTIAYGFTCFALSFACVLFFNNVAMHVIGNMFSGAGIVLINATIPFRLSNIADKSEFPIIISLNTLVSSIAGTIAPIILGALHLSVGKNQFLAGIVISVVLAVILFIAPIGKEIKKVNSAQD
ncbi:MFS family permease [Lactobacillus colini]|uniref:MFS family permease n=1 Tax=Lactobacillus colini TaxID=1819254 RepID=A0ABS4MEZ3_9LACO|nr:MFS transporter [Lactobacillus colini]MBP2058257.1 MFS family permease [Lactobacillus colini]